MDPVEKYLKDNQDRFSTLLLKSKYKSTSKLFSRFQGKINAISDVICEFETANSFYIGAILVRALVEHTLVPYYVWSRFFEKDDDEFAKRYYEGYLVGEILKRDNYAISNDYQPVSIVSQLINKILKKLKEFNVLNQKDLEGYYRIYNEFEFKHICNYIRKTKTEDSYNLILIKRVPLLLEFYNYTSSFIHAGPTADIANFEVKSEEKNEAFIQFKVISQYCRNMINLMVATFLTFESDEIELELENLAESISASDKE